MSPAKLPKTIVQCDFDGTITIKDVSFALLDTFAPELEWRAFLEECHRGKITVGAFNSRAFGMVKASEKTLLDFVGQTDFGIRPGLPELIDSCARLGIELAIVSNGLDFYIKAILARLGVSGVPVFAARSRFNAHGMEVAFTGPDGQTLDDHFKKAYVDHFQAHGYRVQDAAVYQVLAVDIR